MRLTVSLGIFFICPILSAQTPSPDILASLKDEVHELRLAIERSTLLGTRTQIAIGRIQTQQARVAQAMQRLAEVRQELSRFQAERTAMTRDQKSVEDRLSQSSDPNERRALEAQMRQTKRLLEDAGADTEIRGREAELAGQLQTEQNFLNQLQSEMSQLVGSLDRAIQQISGPRQ